MPEILINALTHPAFTGVISFVAGNFFAIGRDWRKEFNEAADDLFTKLTEEHRLPTDSKGIFTIEFQLFRRKMLPWNRRSFDRCVKEYYDAKEKKFRLKEQGIHHQGTPEIRAAIDKLIKFTGRR